MDVSPLFVANTQPPELVQPGKRPLHYPEPSTQTTAMLSVAHREQRHDVAGTQTLADCLGVITAVAQHAVRTMARSPTRSH